MHQHTPPSRLAIYAVALFAMILFAVTGSSTASAQCNEAGCNTIQVDADIANPCAALITRIECVSGTMPAPSFSPYAPGSISMEPCHCANSGGVRAIWVGGKRILVGTSACVVISPGCTLLYDVQVVNGCVRVKIAHC